MVIWPNRRQVRFSLLWICGGLLEWPFFKLLAGEETPWISNHLLAAVGFHLLAALSLYLSLSTRRWSVDAAWGKCFAFFTLFLPMLGWALSGVLFFFYRPPDLSAFFEEDEGFPAAPLLQLAEERKVPRRERIVRELDFVPLADILTGDDTEMKRGAIDKLAQLKTPEAIELLLAHRSDPSIEVRFYISSALTRVKKEFDEELAAAKRQVMKGRSNLKVRVSLARIYLRCARSGLLDEATAASYESEAEFHLGEVTRTDGAPVEAFLLLMDIFRGRSNWDGLGKVIDRLETLRLETPAAIIKARVDCLYRGRRYPEVFQQLGRLKDLESVDAEWQAVLNWWRVAS